MVSRKIDGATRRELWAMSPHDIGIVGHDPGLPRDLSDILYQPHRLTNLHNPAMVATIRAVNVLEPVLVEDRVAGKFKFVVAIGRHRVYNARIASDEEVAEGRPPIVIKCMLQAPNDALTAQKIAIENAHRVGETMLEMAINAVRMMEVNGLSVEQVAVAYGKSDGWVRGAVKLTQATGAVLRAVRDGKIGETHALMLAKAPREEQDAALAALLAAEASGEKITKTAAAQATRDVAAAKAGVEAKQTMPGVREMKRWIERCGTHASPLSTPQVELLEYLIGERKIAGMAAFRRAANTKPAKAEK